MYKQQSSSYSLSFLDMILNLLCAFIVLFMLAIIVLRPETSKKDSFEPKAEYLISLSWPSEYTDDVDLWVRDPLKNMVWFSQKEKGLLNLDRDDLGNKNDEVTDSNGEKVVFNNNKEIVAVRGVVQGEYIVNVHMFRKDEASKDKDIPVFVELIKVNPFSIVKQSNIVLKNKGDEKTAFRFVLDKTGKVVEINNLFVSLTNRQIEEQNGEQP